MSNKFQLGDIVQLKSGGPAMTVSKVPKISGHMTKQKYVCQWFRGASNVSGDFGEEELQFYVAPKKA
ncbi:YodC family protein [Paracoccus jiaweipingae]|uniref:YodC family protein n=1 Tax=unclassified Paracoccus (in: a-proteobacteria) TaxID=2688777 RepID=UPI0037A24F9C